MSRAGHLFYIGIFTAITSIAFISLIYYGYSYYLVSLEERFYHHGHNILKSSGYIGHGLGIMGSLFIILGVVSYMIRKRNNALSRTGLLKHWLEFHIFMCILGTILVVFHTAFKTGGLAAISFWSMLIVFASGIAGRFIYIQIPRTIEGRALDISEAMELKGIAITTNNTKLVRQIEKLETMKKLFSYWHVFHLPFAIMMLLFMLLHVSITVILGYRWIL